VEIIQRRIHWLERRIEEARREHRNAHFDISERIALLWALEQIKMWVDLGPEEDET
jgi:hypothetical protein